MPNLRFVKKSKAYLSNTPPAPERKITMKSHHKHITRPNYIKNNNAAV